MNVTGKIKVRKNEKGTYYTSLASKNEEGSEKPFDFAPIVVKFKKGVELSDGSWIEIKNAFLTFYKYTKPEEGAEEEIRYKIVITDFDILEKKEEKKSNYSNDVFKPSDDFDDLPF